MTRRYGYTTGDIDFLMKEIPARTLFAEDLGHFADLATMNLNMFSNNAMWAVLAVYDVEVDKSHVEFCATLALDEMPMEELVAEFKSSTKEREQPKGCPFFQVTGEDRRPSRSLELCGGAEYSRRTIPSHPMCERRCAGPHPGITDRFQSEPN